MRRHDGLLGIISIALVISMLISLGAVLAGAGFSEPENPLGSNSDPLVPESLSGGGKLTGTGEEDREETMPSEETQPPTEPEGTQPPTEPEATQPPTEPEETNPGQDNSPTAPKDEPEPGPDEPHPEWHPVS